MQPNTTHSPVAAQASVQPAAPDQVFAAQMWNWPDAVIKRDAAGAVLFVNNSFLGLYGGTIENWQGMAITGWNAPPPAGQSYRFETRVPTVEGEQVYDWIECALPDGTALAVARNVSAILPGPGVPVAPEAPMAQAPAQQEATAQAPASAFEYVMKSGASADTSAPLAEAQTSAPATPEAPAIEETAHQAPVAPEPEPEPYQAPPVAEVPADKVAAPLPETEPATVATPAEAAPVAEAPSETPQSEREFERRALPIEDESAVLGNNWRDAVIAKAVGAGGEAPAETAGNSVNTQAAAPAAASPQREDGEPIRILLAEDNAINALLTRTLLEAEGCHVDTVEDGALAVEAIKVNRYDLIFMDMRMPNMDGLDATRKIRSMDHRSKGLPIIALTANAFDDDRNACFDSGMNDFMTKPVSAEELSEMVARWTSEEATQMVAAG